MRVAVAVFVARTNTPVAEAPRGGATAPVYSAVMETAPVVQGAGFRVQGSGFRVQGSGFRVQGAADGKVPYTLRGKT